MFQSLYESDSSLAGAPLMPEWFWLLALMLAVGTLGFAWTPMFLAWLVLVIASATSVLAAARVSGRAIKHGPRSAGRGRRGVLILWSLVLIQPIARLVGRVDQGLTPWRRYGAGRLSRPWPARDARWSGDWQSPTARLRDIEAKLHQSGIPVDRGGGFDQWDLEARIGPLASARLLLAAEEHGEGRQLIRSRIWPRLWGGAIVLAAAAMSTSIAAYLAGAEEVGAVFLVTFLAITAAAIRDAAAAQGALLKAIGR